ncbi:MAG: hydrogenase iron-sulfur subunit [Proteobacteria bacterium]|nr:hydrogenase iron-sulfur subunit [Pseudomonadota bacterium]
MAVFEPKIITFLCNWCSYGAADPAGGSRFQYPANMRSIGVSCSGRISGKMILRAIRNGADGVWVSGCHPGDCRYLEGNYSARRKFALIKQLREHTGLEQGRLPFSWISSAEGVKIVDVACRVIDEIKRLGPSTHLIKILSEVAG